MWKIRSNIPFETLQQNFNIRTTASDIIPNYNIAPTQEILTIIKHDNENTLEKLYWSLVPFWAKDISTGSRMISAGIETVASKPSFRILSIMMLPCHEETVNADKLYPKVLEEGNNTINYSTSNLKSNIIFAISELLKQNNEKIKN